MTRPMEFAGSFYPKSKTKLREFIEESMSAANVGIIPNIRAIVAPHAGYIYSGKVAAFSYVALRHIAHAIDTFVVVGPTHSGFGDDISVSLQDWKTPFGNVKNDLKLSNEILENSVAQCNETSHDGEHSIEVQLPFVSMLKEDPRCAFISMANQSFDASNELADAIFDSALDLKRNVVVIASSDFNHYESDGITRKKDSLLLQRLKDLDAKAFNVAMADVEDSICGYGPVSVACLFAKKAMAKEGKLLKYSTSAESTGDYESVVAYASLAFA